MFKTLPLLNHFSSVSNSNRNNLTRRRLLSYSEKDKVKAFNLKEERVISIKDEADQTFTREVFFLGNGKYFVDSEVKHNQPTTESGTT